MNNNRMLFAMQKLLCKDFSSTYGAGTCYIHCMKKYCLVRYILFLRRQVFHYINKNVFIKFNIRVSSLQYIEIFIYLLFIIPNLSVRSFIKY